MKRENSITSSRSSRKKQKEEPKKKDDMELLEAETEPVQYHCDYCRKDISNSVRISCAICLEFDLCLECFSVGVELRGHKNWHDYRVIDDMHFPFLTRDWSAEEEQLLLEGLELYGIGNWADVSEHVSTKDKNACREHYEKYYLSSPMWPEPDYSKILCSREKVKLLNSGKYNKIKRRDGIVVKKEITQKTKTNPKNKQQPGNQTLHAMSPIHPELNGYMPMRDEFETEWDNDCENKIKDLAFLDEDTPEEISMKMRILEIHNYRLQCRKKWADFVVSRNLHDINLQQKLARSRSKEMKEVHKNLKRFIQIMEPEEYEEFIRGLARERQLKYRIKKLQNYRRKGICTLEEINDYEEDKKQRALEKSREKNRKVSTKNHPLDLTGRPGVDTLSEQERELCEHCHLLPHDYILIKEALLREYVKTGESPLSKIEQLSGMVSNQDFSKVKTVFEFLEKVGWINNRDHTMAQAPPALKKQNQSPAPEVSE